MEEGVDWDALGFRQTEQLPSVGLSDLRLCVQINPTTRTVDKLGSNVKSIH